MNARLCVFLSFLGGGGGGGGVGGDGAVKHFFFLLQTCIARNPFS